MRIQAAARTSSSQLMNELARQPRTSCAIACAGCKANPIGGLANSRPPLRAGDCGTSVGLLARLAGPLAKASGRLDRHYHCHHCCCSWRRRCCYDKMFHCISSGRPSRCGAGDKASEAGNLIEYCRLLGGGALLGPTTQVSMVSSRRRFCCRHHPVCKCPPAAFLPTGRPAHLSTCAGVCPPARQTDRQTHTYTYSQTDHPRA